jgi:CIC family chloride channel protein
METWQRITLVAAGAGAGTATFIARLFLGLRPAFDIPPISAMPLHPAPLYALLLSATLGAATGLAATVFIRGLHFMEGTFLHVRNSYSRHAIGMLLVGALGYGFMLPAGHYYVDGVGYGMIQDVLLGVLASAPLLATLSAHLLI